MITAVKKKCVSLIKNTSHYKKRLLQKGYVQDPIDLKHVLDEAPPLYLNDQSIKKPYVGIIKLRLGGVLGPYTHKNASWLRYERFCKNNGIEYSFYDIEKKDWLEEAKKFDIIVCHVDGSPAYQEMIEPKVYVIDKLMGKAIFPSYHEVWQYEDKNKAQYLYNLYDLPTIPTIVTHCEEEALELTGNVKYPFITKTSIGAGSSGVIKVSNIKEAKKLIKNVFSEEGRLSQYPYKNQKDYFYFQDYIEDATFDLRIMIIDDKAFGYYRYPNKGDYKASGSGIYEKKEIPSEAILLAVEVSKKLNSRQLGVDLLYSKKIGKYLIIETSLFNQIDSASQLEVEGISGYYDITDLNNINFKAGNYWVQELTLRNIIQSWQKGHGLSST